VIDARSTDQREKSLATVEIGRYKSRSVRSTGLRSGQIPKEQSVRWQLQNLAMSLAYWNGGADPVVEDDIRSVLAAHARLDVDVTSLSAGDDLYRSGLTSHGSVNIMLALEDKFNVEFPAQMLRKSTFESIRAIQEAITELTTA
jgi:acyl carrier protein